MSNFRKLLWVAIFFIFSSGLFAGGKQGIRAGVLKLHPDLSVGLGYTSNVYQTDQPGAPSDFYITPSLSLKVELPLLTHSFVIGGGFSYVKYFKEEKQNAASYFFMGDFDFNFVGGLGFELYEKFSYTREPILGNYENVTERLPHYNNTLSPILTYKIPSGAISTTLQFDWKLDKFPTDPDYDLTSYGGKLGLVYKFLPKTGLYFNLYGGQSVKPNDNDLSGWSLRSELGLSGMVTSKLTATIGFGWVYGDFSDSTQQNEPIIRIGLEEKFSKLMRLNVSYLRNSQVSFVSNFHVVNVVKASLWRALTPTLAATVSGGWWRVDYYPSLQQDNNYDAGLALNYNPVVLTWLSVDGGYRFHRRDSTAESFRYTEHRFFVNVEASW